MRRAFSSPGFSSVSPRSDHGPLTQSIQDLVLKGIEEGKVETIPSESARDGVDDIKSILNDMLEVCLS